MLDILTQQVVSALLEFLLLKGVTAPVAVVPCELDTLLTRFSHA